jgi:hypothetical protein
MPLLLIAIALGATLGVVAAHMLFLQWFTLIPWGIAGLLLGYWGGREKAILSGALYGFALVFSFLVAGYTGNPPLLGRVPPFALIGIFGAACGVGLTVVGSFVRRRLKP